MIILAAIVAATACGGHPPSENTLATSDLGAFTRRDLDRFIAILPESERRPAPGQDPTSWRLDMAREMVTTPVLLEEGRRLVARDADRAAQLERSRRRFLVNVMKRRLERQRTPTSAKEVRAYYDTHSAEFSRGESLRLRHIFRRVARTASDEERRSVRSEVEAILGELHSGASFDDLARSRSQSESAAAGGLLGPVERGALDRAIEDEVWSLAEGEVSAIVSTPAGFHVFKVEGRHPPLRTAFEEVRGRILRGLEVAALRNSAARELQVLLTASGATYHPERLPDAWPAPATDLVTFSDPEDDDLELTVGDLRSRWETLSFAQRRWRPPEDLLFGAALDNLLLWEARRLKVAEQPETAAELAALEERLLLEMAYAERLDRWMETLPESTLRDLYETESERWRTPRLHHLRILSRDLGGHHPDMVFEELVAAAAEVRSGGRDFADLASQLSDDVSRSDGGDVGWLRLEEIATWIGSGAIKALSTLRPGAVSDPLPRTRTDQIDHKARRAGFLIVQVVEVREPQQQPFEMVRREVARQFLDLAPDQARAQIRDQLLASTHAVIFEENL